MSVGYREMPVMGQAPLRASSFVFFLGGAVFVCSINIPWEAFSIRFLHLPHEGKKTLQVKTSRRRFFFNSYTSHPRTTYYPPPRLRRSTIEVRPNFS